MTVHATAWLHELRNYDPRCAGYLESPANNVKGGRAQEVTEEA